MHMSSVYVEQGFATRREYLESLADDFDLPLAMGGGSGGDE